MSLLLLGGTVSFAAKLLPVYSRASLRGPLSKCHPRCRTCTSHPPQKVAHSGTRCFLAERVLHQYAEAPRRPPQPYRRRRRQQVPGGCERPTAPHRVQLRGSQTHEASLALHSGDHRRRHTCSENFQLPNCIHVYYEGALLNVQVVIHPGAICDLTRIVLNSLIPTHGVLELNDSLK